MNSSSYVPVPKVIAAGLGGALATLAVWLLGALFGVDVPAEAASALTALLAFACGYVKAPADHGDRGSVDVVTLLVVVVLVLLTLVLAGDHSDVTPLGAALVIVLLFTAVLVGIALT